MRPALDRDAFREAYTEHSGDMDSVRTATGCSRAMFYAMKRELGLNGGASPAGSVPSSSGSPEGGEALIQALRAAIGPVEANGKALEAVQDSLEAVIADVEALKAAPARADVLEVRIEGRETKSLKGPVPDWAKEALELVAQDIPALLVGPAGCGKTFEAGRIAEALGLRFGFTSLSAGVSEAELTGWLVPGAGGEFQYLPAPFVDFYENGGVYLLDELDAADPNVLLVINAALANGHLSLPRRKGNTVAKRHPDFRIIGAANTFGEGANRQYQGRNALDGATLDRFEFVEASYSEAVEESLIPGPVLSWGRGLRSGLNRHGIRRILSTRKLIHYGKLSAAGWSIDRIQALYLRPFTAGERAKLGASHE